MTKPITRSPGQGRYRSRPSYNRGELNAAWRGGVTVTHEGYVRVRIGGQYRLAHVVAAEAALGKLLPLLAVVHHRDDDRANNGNDNLVICENSAYHTLLHRRRTAWRATRNAESRRCVYCSEWLLPSDPEARSYRKSGSISARSFYHLECARLRQQRKYAARFS